MNGLIPVFAIVGAICLWSTAAPATKLALQFTGAWEIILAGALMQMLVPMWNRWRNARRGDRSVKDGEV